MNVVLILPNWIGDVVMATPTLRALRQHYGDVARMIGVMRPYVAQVLSGTNWLDQEIFFDRRSKNREYGTRRVVARLRSARPDVAIAFTKSLSG